MARRTLASRILAPLDSFYPTAKRLYMWRMRRRFYRYDLGPVLLLQLGKVGSKSVQAGLEATIRDRPIYHSHFLSAERTAETERSRREFFRTDRHTYLMRPWQNEFLLRTFREHRDDRVWKIITLTREPIGRNVSAFFENLDVTKGERPETYEISSHYYGIDPMQVAGTDTETLKGLFLSRATHDSALHFFDREIRDIFGIDVIAAGFPQDRGWATYSGERAELLVIKLEALERVARDAIGEFLGIDGFELINSNIGAEKVYAPMYRHFKKSAALDADYVDRLLESDYMRTFYDGDEIRSARERWLAN